MNTDVILELNSSGIHTMPLKFINGNFVHPVYNEKYDTGFTNDEIKKLIKSGYSGGIAVFHSKCNPHIMCLDFDEKNAIGKKLYETWRHLIDEDLLMRLVIEKTKSAGYHVYFKCTELPTTKALANSENGAEWIACRSALNNSISYCAPSPGYSEIQGCLFDLQEITPYEMRQLCDAAVQLNEYRGAKTSKDNYLPMILPPVEYAGIVRAFDYYVPSDWTLDYLTGMKWTAEERAKYKMVNNERWEYTRLWRPGKDNTRESHTAYYWYNTKKLSVFSSSTEMPYFDSGENFSHTPSRVVYFNNDRDWAKTVHFIEEECERLGIKLPKEMPLATMKEIGKKLVWRVEPNAIIDWAERMGYRWMKLTNADDIAVQFIRVIDNVIMDSDERDLIRLFREYVNENYKQEDANRVLISFIPSLFKYMDSLKHFDGKINRDTKDASFIYFSNGALRITKNTTQLIKYSELDACVFHKHIKTFEYNPTFMTGNFGKFIKLISMDQEHEQFIKSSLGYILHHYKLKNYAKALMIIEDVDDQEEARGRSGKGLIAQFVEWLRWVIQQDGRNFKADSQFKMQRVVPGVQVFYMNDPAASMLMGQFYNLITDDWPVEAKGKKSFSIAFRNSPKILITTNYLPNLESDSDKDRFIVLPIKKYFSASHTIRDEFPDNIFFDEDWNSYDRDGAVRFAIECVQLYLQNGVTNYVNAEMKRNAELRVIKTHVPDVLVDTVEQAMEIAKNSQNQEQFKRGLEVIDLRANQPETITKAFGWEEGKIVIYVNSLYLYCMRAFNWKTYNGKLFGKWVRLYIDRMGYKRSNEVRNNKTGVRLTIFFDRTGGNFDRTDGDFDRTDVKKDDKNISDGFKPLPGADDLWN